MNIEHLTLEEIKRRIEQGLLDYIPSGILEDLLNESYQRGYDLGFEEGSDSWT